MKTELLINFLLFGALPITCINLVMLAESFIVSKISSAANNLKTNDTSSLSIASSNMILFVSNSFTTTAQNLLFIQSTHSGLFKNNKPFSCKNNPVNFTSIQDKYYTPITSI